MAVSSPAVCTTSTNCAELLDILSEVAENIGAEGEEGGRSHSTEKKTAICTCRVEAGDSAQLPSEELADVAGDVRAEAEADDVDVVPRRAASERRHQELRGAVGDVVSTAALIGHLKCRRGTKTVVISLLPRLIAAAGYCQNARPASGRNRKLALLCSY